VPVLSAYIKEKMRGEVAMRMEIIEKAVRMILEEVGEDPDREGLRDTPRRVARFYQEAFVGLHDDPNQYLAVQFSENHEEMVIVKDIPIYSMCEHHLLPFVGAYRLYSP